MKIRILLAATSFWTVASVFSSEAPSDSWPDFSQYHVDLYKGAPHIPKGYSKDADGIWRDSNKKAVGEPVINFAGTYYVALHSCGAGCRYYTMNNMATGEDNDSLRMFASAEPPPKTSEGYPYVTDLVTKADSRMFIAKYQIDAGEKQLCRERAFVIDQDMKIKPITKTKDNCD